MKYPIEYRGEPVRLTRNGLWDSNDDPVTPAERSRFVHVCSWCDERHILTNSLHSLGFSTSHGICEKHFNELTQ